MSKLKDKVAIVTGGASGIGEASVREFGAEGAQVISADVTDGDGQRIVDDHDPHRIRAEPAGLSC